MDDYNESNSKVSEEDLSFTQTDENKDITKLKVEVFHLRLRCYNLEEQCSNCKCDKNKSDVNKDFFDHRTQLNQVVLSQQELKWENDRLIEDNRLLREKCGDINEDLEKKLYDYESLKKKYDQLSIIVENDCSIPSAIQQIMKDNDSLIKTNVERKIKIRHLEKKLADMNNSFVEEESLRRKSLTQSMAKIIRETNDTSFRNSRSCLQCDELKVYSDKLSETVIKMTIDFQSLNRTLEQKNIEMANLDAQIVTLKSKPDVNVEQFNKYKKISKQLLRKYEQEKKSHKEMVTQFEELIEYYIKQQGELQQELDTLKRQYNSLNKKRIDENNTIGELFVKKLSEVQDANNQMTSVVKSVNLSHSNVADYDQVGQYSPQYKIRTDLLGNSSVVNDSDSVYYDKNISFNTTLFKSRLDDTSMSESNIHDVVDNMQQKVRELGEVVQSYLTMIKDDHDSSVGPGKDKSSRVMSDYAGSDNTSQWTNDKTDINDSQLSIKDEMYLKRIYEEEKQRFDHLLEEKVTIIDQLVKDIELLQLEKAVSDSNHRVSMDKMSEEYSTTVAKYHQKIKLLSEEKESIQKKNKDINDEMSKLEAIRKEMESQHEEENKKYCNDIKELENRIDELRQENFEAKEVIIYSNENLQMKLNEMELVFNKVKSIIDEHSLDGDEQAINLTQLWRMLLLLETSMREKTNVVETVSKSLSTPSWNTMSEDEERTHLAELAENIENSENRFYTSSLNLRMPSSMTEKSEVRLHDLTNVTEFIDEQLPEIPKMDAEVNSKDKFKYIRENPEKIHQKLKYFYETCEKLKKVAIREHEENKKLKKNLSSSVCQAIDEMTKKIDDFKRQLDLCKECLVRSQSSLPDAVTQELKQLNLL